MKMRLTGTALALSIFGAGCGAGAPAAPVTTVLPTNPTNPTNPTVASSSHDLYSGVYNVKSTLDLAQAGALPDSIGTILADLNNVQKQPATTLYKLALAADPSLKLPSLVSSLALSAIDTVLTNPNSSYAAQLGNVTSVAQQLSTLASSFEVDMAMTIANPDAKGSAPVDQQISSLTFTTAVDQPPQVIAIPAASKAAARSTVTGQITPATDAATAADASITIATSTFTVPFGNMIMQAAGPLVFQPVFGTNDLATGLSASIDCGQVGTDVNDELNTYIDVTSIVTSICKAALAQAATEVETQFNALSLSGVSVQGIQGQLSDAPVGSTTIDHQSDSVKGTWTWEIPTSSSPAAVASSWSGARAQ